ncbi:MAG TPA: radical SAM protein, partial [Desulfomonilaceae bacterium]|nr:radical SAM protein [Desulfomonilaceae bacterium]
PHEKLPDKIAASTGFSLSNRPQWSRFELSPSPAFDLLSHPTYIPLLTGRGCIFKCPYCASGILQPTWQKRPAKAIYEEISNWHRECGVVDFAFYDDALLIQAESGLEPALRRIREELPELRFHTPNAIHICALTPNWCQLLYESGFTTLRLGLETTRSEKQRDWGGKVKTEMFILTVDRLFAAGFSSDQVGVYLLCGLPGQSPKEVAEAIHVVKETGAHPYIAEYSPIPGTQMWPDAIELSQFDIAAEPLYHNNTFFACRRPDFSYQDLMQLKDLAGQARRDSTRRPAKGA